MGSLCHCFYISFNMPGNDVDPFIHFEFSLLTPFRWKNVGYYLYCIVEYYCLLQFKSISKILFQLIEIVVFKPQITKNKKKKREEKKSWLIDFCLTSSRKYFMHIQDQNKFNKKISWNYTEMKVLWQTGPQLFRVTGKYTEVKK